MRKFLLSLIFVSVSTFAYWSFLEFPFAGIDDANIYFTYAKNLSEGHGLVYNVGGEKVEGFTSVLWMLICSLVYSMSVKNLVFGLTALNVILISGLVFLLINLFESLNFFSSGDVKWNRVLLLGLVFLTPGWFEWNVLSVMETGLWSLVLFVAFYISHSFKENPYRSLKLILLLIPVMIVVRPESMVWVFALGFLFALMSLYLQFSKKRILIYSGSILVVGVVCMLLITLWRLHTFGFPFPNTYYAKVSNDLIYNIGRGFQYVIWFMLKIRISNIVFILILIASYHIYRAYQAEKEITSVNFHQSINIYFIIVGLLVPFPTGGDHFVLNRFYQPILPMMLIFLLYVPFWKKIFPHFFESIKSFSSPQKYFGLFAVFFLTYFCLTPIPYYQAGLFQGTIRGDFTYPEESWEYAQKFEDFFEPLDRLPSTARQAVGGLGYAYDGFVVDMYGLNDVEMAHYDRKKYGIKNHAAFSIEVFLKKAPDFFNASFLELNEKIEGRQFSRNKKPLKHDPLKGLYSNQEFHDAYVLAAVSKTEYTQKLFGYFNRKFLESLSGNSLYSIEKLEQR